MTEPGSVKGNGSGGVYDDRECSCPREFYQRDEINASLFFEDCLRSIDFVLAYRISPHEPTETENSEKRRVFEANLANQGLEVEASQKDQICFVKVGRNLMKYLFRGCSKIDSNYLQIHAPLEVLRRYAEILKLRMPMKEVSLQYIDFFGFYLNPNQNIKAYF